MKLFLEISGLAPVVAEFDCYGMSGSSKDRMLKDMNLRRAFKKPVYIGDTALDEKAAAAAGMDFIHAAYGFGTANAKMSFDSFLALTGYFKNL